MKDRSHFPAVKLFPKKVKTKTPRFSIHQDRLVMSEYAHRRWTKCVLNSELSSITKLILLTISLLTEKYFFIGVNLTLEQIQFATSLSNPTVIKHIKIARKSSFLHVEKDKNNSVYYTILFQDENGGNI